MKRASAAGSMPGLADPALQVYLLGSVDFDAVLALQRRLVYQIGGNRTAAALVLCEHPPLVTIGRDGSWAHLRCEPGELKARQWPVRWVNRGGGCVLHLPGQLAIYPILALDRLGLGVQDYLDRLGQVLVALLADFSIRAEAQTAGAGIRVADRPIAAVGVAVRDWISYYGAVLNVSPDLQPFRLVRGETTHGMMTSLARERRGPLRPSLVRERLIEHFVARFEFARTAIFFEDPFLPRKAPSDAVATSS